MLMMGRTLAEAEVPFERLQDHSFTRYTRTEQFDRRNNSWLALAGRPFNATPNNVNNRITVRNYLTEGDTGTYRVGDWLINYAGGFVRRGLFGEVLFAVSPPGAVGGPVAAGRNSGRDSAGKTLSYL